MKMKQMTTMVAALAFTFSATAQSVDEGIKMFNYERYESAKKVLEPLAASNPVANYYLGLSHLAQGNVEAAKITFNKYADNYASEGGKARVAFAEGKATEGMQIAQGLAAKAKKKDWEQYRYAADAITYSKGGDAQKAIDWYAAALAQQPDNAALLIAQGDAYQMLVTGGGKAASNYEKVAGKDAKNSMAFTRLGKIWYDARNYELALENWKKASDADPQNPVPYRDLARAYQASGKYEVALQNVEKYYELSDKTTADKLAYMDVLYLTKNYDRAIKMAQEVVNSGVKEPRVYGLMGFAQSELKDTANALKNAAIYIHSGDAKKVSINDNIQFARILMQNSQYDSADVYFSRAVAMDENPVKSATYREIGEKYRLAVRWKNAASWYQRIVDTDPAATATDYFYTGYSYYNDKNYADAEKWFAKMEEKFPEQPSAPYWRARVAAATDDEGKAGTAVPHFTRWLEKVGPNYDKKKDLLLAYQYMLLYYYNKNDKENQKKYEDLAIAIDPNDALVKQIRDASAKKK